jgi:hypothetical protein
MRIATMRLTTDKKGMQGSCVDAISLNRGCPVFVMRVAGSDRYELHSLDAVKIDTSPENMAAFMLPDGALDVGTDSRIVGTGKTQTRKRVKQ